MSDDLFTAPMDRCPDCGVHVGFAHDLGCDIARCLRTGYQRIGCDHFAVEGWVDHCGMQVFDGYWPGERDAIDLGLVFTYANGMKIGDLNRLHLEAEWDPATQHWKLK